MSMSLVEFNKRLDKAIQDKWVKPITELHAEMLVRLYGYIVIDQKSTGGAYGSPVLTGRYANSHAVSLNTIYRGVQPINPEGSSRAYPTPTLQPVMQAIANFKLGDVVYISNSLPYAQNVEKLGWGGASSYHTPPYETYMKATERIRLEFSGNVTGKFRKINLSVGGGVRIGGIS